ncbi:MAG: DUF4215 domain-containing protein [Polyangiaceae bacterium]
MKRFSRSSMRATARFATVLLAASCSTGCADDEGTTLSTGGASGSGGTSGTAGSAGSSAGSSGTAGSAGTGGTAGSSGSSGTGGTAGSAGSSGTGGTAGTGGSSGSSGSGGTSGTGGTAGAGGTSGTGGTAGTGGTGGTGGTSGTGGTGGASGTGGTGGLGGTAGTGGTSGAGGVSGTGGTAGSGGVAGTGGVAGVGGSAGTISSQCNDGQITSSEQCDDGNNNDGDGCSSTCQIESGWECGGTPSECGPICGDGLVAGSEQCDLGAKNSDDFLSGCDTSCSYTSLVVWLDGNDPNGDGSATLDDTAITTWKDKARGLDATQSLATRQATYKNAISNGRGGLVFEGDDLYAVPFDINRSVQPELTIVAVFINGAGDPQTFAGVWGNDNGGWDRFMTSGGTGFTAGISDGTGFSPVTGISVDSKVLVTVATLKAGETLGSRVYTGGKVGTMFTENLGGLGGTSFSVGSINEPNFFMSGYQFDGQYLELLVFNHALSTSELTTLNDLMSQRYPGSFCGDGIVQAGEGCDDGINDGSLCSSTCTQVATTSASFLSDCDSTSNVLSNVNGVGCHNLDANTAGGASYITLGSATSAIIFTGPNCTGATATINSDADLCSTDYSDATNANDNVGSIKLFAN